MGNKGSQFETQFHKRYSFIQSIDDKLFGVVKIYRKNTVKFDYIMILQVQLQQLSADEVETLQQRLRQARSYQNETTLRIYHFKVQDRASLECRERRLVIYAQYMNRSVFDYLCALRSNPKFVFEVSEIVYVIKNVAKGCIVLKRMGITNPDLSSTRIFLSPQGQALLCPLLHNKLQLDPNTAKQIPKIFDSINESISTSINIQFKTAINKFTVIDDWQFIIAQNTINNVHISYYSTVQQYREFVRVIAVSLDGNYENIANAEDGKYTWLVLLNQLKYLVKVYWSQRLKMEYFNICLLFIFYYKFYYQNIVIKIEQIQIISQACGRKICLPSAKSAHLRNR